MLISSESLEALELPSVLRLVAEGAATDVGRRKVLEMAPSSSRDTLLVAVDRGREVARLLEDGPVVQAFEEPIEPLLVNLERRRASVDGQLLIRLRELLQTTHAAKRRIEEADPPTPALERISGPLPEKSGLVKRLTETLDARGRVRDDATPLLATLRRQSLKVRQQTYSVLERYVREHGDEVAEDAIPLHEERLVVLLRAGSKGKLSGLVHGRSGSGQSFYFEPLEIVDANNELRTVRDEEEAEKRRILAELIDAVCADLDGLRSHLDFLAELDLRQTAARWAERCTGVWTVPEPGGDLRLEGARHPLLDPRLADVRKKALGQSGHERDLVPLALELTDETRVLVVTGPNAGGKTVALKTLGLMALVAHCGLPVPAGPGSRIPLLHRMVATVGDEQDLLTDRSTFSGRLLRLKEAWDWSAPGTMVLLDELGSGTDPQEGAALGIGLIEGLLEKGAMAVVSSHLTSLAAAALELDGAACAAMAFDSDSSRPTYQLLPGTPGGSEALALARRLELPDAWIDRAEDLLGPEHGRLQKLLAEVEEVRGELAAELGRAQSESRRLAAEVEASVAARADLESARDRAAGDARRALGDFRRKVRKRLGQEVERLREEIEAGRRRGLEAEAVERIFRDPPVAEPERSSLPVELGGKVRHRALGWVGKVERITGERAEVAVAGKRVVCRLDELDGLAGESPRSGGGGSRQSVSTPEVEELPDKELQLRGERVEEALEMLDTYLDRALLAGLAEVRIVHGHGTGRLKQAVREALDEHPAASKWRPGGRAEGGDGATVVSLSG